ncbi:hypothetical protein I4U23_023165 [Adineta vaga]|nr:hypothetical protein I4U23_023165 [Adineta vaga]
MKMSNKFTRLLLILIIFGLSITLISFSQNLQYTLPNKIRSLDLSDFWIRSNTKMISFLHNGVVFRTSQLLIQINGNLETKIECIGSFKNQSCLFKNLYYINRTFWILTTKETSFPLPSVRIGSMVSTLITPSRRRFYSYKDLEDFVHVHIQPIVIPNLTVYFDQLWLMNIGHALFDGLYPAYLALIRFSPRHLHSFRILLSTNGYNGNHSFSQDVYNRFAGLETMNASILEDMSIGKWFAFEELIMGSGDMCQRCLQPNLQLPGGIELNGSQLFRERMYKRHGLKPPIPREKHSAERRDPKKTLIAIIIDNKRFTIRDRIEISAAIHEINNYNYNQTDNNWPLIHISYITYSEIQMINNEILKLEMKASKDNNNKMRQHLQLLQNVDIHITGPGTGQMYQTFLSDGSININLGGLHYIKHNMTYDKYPVFMEQYVTSGISYIKGLYYPMNERSNGIRRKILIKLIREAAQLITNGFSIPINPNDNLAAYGQLFIEMCERDKNFCRTVTDRWEENNFWCFNTWPETIIYEDGPWSLDGIIDDDKNVTCSYNRTLLYELKEKYNITERSQTFFIE